MTYFSEKMMITLTLIPNSFKKNLKKSNLKFKLIFKIKISKYCAIQFSVLYKFLKKLMEEKQFYILKNFLNNN